MLLYIAALRMRHSIRGFPSVICLLASSASCARSVLGTCFRWGSSSGRSSASTIVLEYCGHPLIAGMRWMTAPIDEERRRNTLARKLCEVGDIAPERKANFEADLDLYHIVAVAMSPAAIKSRPAKTLLRVAGFKKLHVVDGYHIWVRTKAHQLPGRRR